MVPFEFASVLLLVAMIGTVLLSKKKQRNNMNNILNEIGIEKHFPFYDNFFVLGSLAYYTGEMQLSYLCSEIMLNGQSFVCCISTYHQDAQGQIFVFFSMAVAAAEVA
jgi:NADH-quinone oxidoreductase subunit K